MSDRVKEIRPAVGQENDVLLEVMSLSCGFCLRPFCSPLLGFFRLVPGFVEVKKDMYNI